MRVVLLIAAGWIAGSLVVAMFVGVLAGGRYREPKPERLDGEDDLLAGTAEALGDVYGEPASHHARPGDRLSDAILERRVVRATRPGRAPIR